MRPIRPAAMLLLIPLAFPPNQDPGARRQPAPPLEMLHAGRAQYTRGDAGRTVTVLTDSVLFRQGDQYVLADMATYVSQQDLVTFRGNVRGWDPEWRFRSDEVLYRGRERTFLATGRFESERVSDGTLLRSAQLRFDRTTDEGVASGFPYLYRSPTEEGGLAAEVVGKERALIRFHREQGWAEISGGATVRRGSMSVSGAWIRSEGDSRTLIVRDGVRMVREGVRAEGDLLTWDEEAGLARLFGSPPILVRHAPREEGSMDSVMTTMTADSLDIGMFDDRLQSLRLYGPGEMNLVTIPAPRADPDSVVVPERMVLKGQDILIQFEEERLRRLEARRAAMYYWRVDSPFRQNALGGLDLIVEFTGGEPSRVTAKGNATTRYFKDPDSTRSEMERAQGSLIRLVVKDGALVEAYLENADARHYSAEMVRIGIVPMAVHPDSIKVGATRKNPSRPPPPPLPGPPCAPPLIAADRIGILTPSMKTDTP